MAEKPSNFSTIKKFLRNARTDQWKTFARFNWWRSSSERKRLFFERRKSLQKSRDKAIIRELATNLQIELEKSGQRQAAIAVQNLLHTADTEVIDAINLE